MKSTLSAWLLHFVTSAALVAWAVLLPDQTWADSPVSPPVGLVDWWPGEGDSSDWAGTNNGTLVGGVSFVPGKVGQAFNFDGGTSFVQLPSNLFPFPFSGTGNVPFSFELWFRTTSPGVILGQQVTIPFQNPLNYVPAIYIGTDDELRVEMFWNGSPDPITTTNTVCDGNFHHLAVVYDGTNQTLFLDSALAGSKPWTESGYATGYNYQFGTGYASGWPGGNGGWFSFNGLIDDLRLYNRALSSNEVAGLYASGSAGISRSATICNQPQSQIVVAGRTATFAASASGAPTLSYQWLLNGTNLTDSSRISGSGSNTLTVAGTQFADAGTYQLTVTNTLGSSTSAPVVLIVFAPTAYCDVAADFGTNANPNGVWSYGWCTNVGDTFQLFTNLISYASGVCGYCNDLALPDSCNIWGNSTANPVLADGTIWVDPDTLMIDPESYSALVRFTAPTNGAYHVQGLFRLQCTITHAHDLTIQVNTNIIVYYVYTQGGQLNTEYPFDLPCNLRRGDTLDFIVSCHSGDYVALPTGLKATVMLVSNPSLPNLGITQSGATVMVSWPSSATGCVLQQNPNLATANWITNGCTISDDGTNKSITITPPTGSMFFRLKQ